MRMKNCTTLAKFEKVLITINDMPHHLSAVRLQTNQMWQGRTFGLPNVGLWIDTQSCAGNTLYDNAKNSGKKLLQIEK